ncbi:hypothetical protein BC629DRAFT_1592035 [Irpex lacteus]|nr:hypothetical protein BC629DRAFT_1592035 [Irpex lacteus]
MATSNSEEVLKDEFRRGTPFDEDDADLILRSSDGLDFRVHKLILRMASPTVPLQEDGVVLEQLLRLCYPTGSIPKHSTLDSVSSLLKVCEKYQMHGIMERLACIELPRFVNTDPFRTYALAYRANVTQEMQRAAYECLTLSLDDIVAANIPEIRDLPASAYRGLLLYHRRCRQIAASIANGPHYQWIGDSTYCWVITKGHDAPCAGALSRRVVRFGAATQPYAPPRRPRLAENIPFPKDLPCSLCRAHVGEHLNRFLHLLEREIERMVKAVVFTLEL